MLFIAGAPAARQDGSGNGGTGFSLLNIATIEKLS